LYTISLKSQQAGLLFQYATVALAFVIPLSIAAYTALSAALLILWIIEGNWHYKWKMIKNQPFFKAFGLFYLFLVASLLWSENLSQGLEHLRKYYFVALLLPILYTSIDRKRIPQIFNAFLAAMIISEILSYLIFFDLMPFRYKESWSSIDPSPFMHHTPYSIFLIFTIFVMVIRLLYEKRTRIQLFIYSFFIFTMTANLFLNSGRTGQLSLLITLIVFLTVYFKLHWIKTLLLTTAISTTVFTIAFFSSPNFHNRSIETYQTFYHLITHREALKNDSTGFRFMMWQTAGAIISEEPLIGVGIGDERDAYRTTLSTKLPQLKDQIIGFSDFHNTFLQITVSAGLIGLGLLLWVFYTLSNNLSPNRELKTIGNVMLTLWMCFMLIGNFPAAYLTVLIVLVTAITLRHENELFSNADVQ
jgi:O-antigen ligase